MQLVQAARAVVTMSSGQPSVAVLTRSAIAESQELSGLLLVLVVLIIVVLLLTSGARAARLARGNQTRTTDTRKAREAAHKAAFVSSG